MTGEALDDFEQKIILNVGDHGCQVNFIFDPDGDQPDFSYSIGFEASVGQPEVIVFGLSQTVTHSMINETLRRCREGFELTDWAEIDGLLEGHRCVVRLIAGEKVVRGHFKSAIWYHRYMTGRTLGRAVQIVWPGAVDGLFPWDDGCADIVKDLQPALYQRRLDA